MIFFILPADQRNDFDRIRIPNNEFAKQRIQKGEAFVLVPWNEVYSSMEAMLIAIREAAQQDPICCSYLKRFELFYTINLLQKDNPLFDKMWDTLFYWSHPMIGNLIHSPRIRPVRWDKQYELNWLQSDALSEGSKALLVWLAENMPKLRRASRDQCRICSNIVELARAFLGEMTCFFTRKLEKVLALRLCLSPSLYGVQCQMLAGFPRKNSLRVLKEVEINGIRALEYGRYYLPGEASRLTGESAVHLFTQLFNAAIGGEVSLANELEQRCYRAWTRLPPVIRCASLMNDIRKLDTGWAKGKEPRDRTSMTIAGIAGTKTVEERDFNYQAGPSAGSDYVVRFRSKGSDLSWSWNRDEAHDATITYRYNLCPLWAGASGHMVGNIAYWKFALGTEFPADGAATLSSALFSLWRLYYDRRISGDHTLVETFEATNLFIPPSESLPVGGFESIRPEDPWPQDSYEVVRSCAGGGFDAVDPIRLIRLLMISNPTTIDGVNRTLRDAQESLSQKYWLPQWSHELSQTIGTEVISFPSDRVLIVEPTEHDPLTPVVTKITVQFNQEPGDFEMNVGPQGVFAVFDIEQDREDSKRYLATTTALPYGYSSKAEIIVRRPVLDAEDRILIFPINKSVVGGQTVTLNVQLV